MPKDDFSDFFEKIGKEIAKKAFNIGLKKDIDLYLKFCSELLTFLTLFQVRTIFTIYGDNEEELNKMTSLAKHIFDKAVEGEKEMRNTQEFKKIRESHINAIDLISQVINRGENGEYE